MPRFDDSILRMIDANLNRCREGLRVLEDCARFGIDNASLSSQLKTIRHTLRSSIDTLGLPLDTMIAARDTEGDVGVSISTDQENKRSGMRDLVLAAAKRATEALRVIEESTKTLGSTGSTFGSLRYQLYDIERELIIALHPPCPQWLLCVLVSCDLCTHYRPDEIIRFAAEGGADSIQIREKHMPDSQLLQHAGELRELAHSLGMHVMINDRAHIAHLVGADGVHLGQDDLPIAAARDLLGPRAWIGRTCPTLSDAMTAVQEGADMCGLGPVFQSSTKIRPSLAGLNLIEGYLEEPQTLHTPMLAISGINPGNIDQLSSLGCPGVAVSSAICSSEDPLQVTRSIVDSIRQRKQRDAPTIGA